MLGGRGGGFDGFDVVRGEGVFGGAVEDDFQVVGSGAETFVHFGGDEGLGGDGLTVGVLDGEFQAAVMLGHAFEAVEIAQGGLVDFVEHAENVFSGGGAEIGAAGAAADFLVEHQFVVFQAAGTLFQNFTGARAHLGAAHVACKGKVPGSCGHLPSGCI